MMKILNKIAENLHVGIKEIDENKAIFRWLPTVTIEDGRANSDTLRM